MFLGHDLPNEGSQGKKEENRQDHGVGNGQVNP